MFTKKRTSALFKSTSKLCFSSNDLSIYCKRTEKPGHVSSRSKLFVPGSGHASQFAWLSLRSWRRLSHRIFLGGRLVIQTILILDFLLLMAMILFTTRQSFAAPAGSLERPASFSAQRSRARLASPISLRHLRTFIFIAAVAERPLARCLSSVDLRCVVCAWKLAKTSSSVVAAGQNYLYSWCPRSAGCHLRLHRRRGLCASEQPRLVCW